MTESTLCTADMLREKGFRATPQRVAICEALKSIDSHPSVAEIYEYVRKRDKTISLATVYNTLQAFKDAGLVREICFRDQPTRYDAMVDSHINLVCSECGSIEDFDFEEIELLIPEIEEQTGFKVDERHFEVYGICKRCRKKMEAEKAKE